MGVDTRETEVEILRQLLVKALYWLGDKRAAPSLQKKILGALHPEIEMDSNFSKIMSRRVLNARNER